MAVICATCYVVFHHFCSLSSLFNLFIYNCSLQHECVYKETKLTETVQKRQKKKKNNFCKTSIFILTEQNGYFHVLKEH